MARQVDAWARTAFAAVIALACAGKAEQSTEPAGTGNGGTATTMSSGGGGADGNAAGAGAAGAGGAAGAATLACDCPPDGMTPRPLECLCGSEPCPESTEEALANPYIKCEYISLREGCGLRVVSAGYMTGSRYSYDLETGALVSAVRWTDVRFNDCILRIEAFGVAEEPCEQYTECTVCASDRGLPTCE